MCDSVPVFSMGEMTSEVLCSNTAALCKRAADQIKYVRRTATGIVKGNETRIIKIAKGLEFSLRYKTRKPMLSSAI